MLPGIISVVEQLKSMSNQLANLCNIKVKQEFELILLDIKVTYVNIFMYEPIKIMAWLIKINTSTVINKWPI